MLKRSTINNSFFLNTPISLTISVDRYKPKIVINYYTLQDNTAGLISLYV